MVPTAELRLPADGVGGDRHISEPHPQPAPGRRPRLRQTRRPAELTAGLKACALGRSFVTTAPCCSSEVAGHEIGDTLQLGGPGNVRVKARVDAQFPIDRLEVITNGAVVATANPDASGLAAEFDGEIPVTTSGWIAVRASGPAHHDLPTGSQYAHTSPVYVTVAGAPIDAKRDAEYFLQWIDRLHLAIRVRDRIPSDDLQKHVEFQLDAARDVYRGLLP